MRLAGLTESVLIAGIILLTVLGGVGLTRRRFRGAQCAAWLLTVLAVVATEYLTRHASAAWRMVAICAALFFGMKSVVGAAVVARGEGPLPVTRWLCFALGWPGMTPAVFRKRSARFQKGGQRLMTSGLVQIGLGVLMVAAARWAWVRTGSAGMALFFLLPGLSFVVHFGLFRIAAGFWRQQGFPCRPVFRNPIASTTLSEFWGRRWNLAFVEMIQLSLYRPILKRFGSAFAVLCGFAFSGLLHELAISVPARSGYGAPLLYFLVQGILALSERVWPAWRKTLLRHPSIGRAWTFGVIVLALPLLLVPAFVRQVLWPIVGIRQSP